MRTGFVIRSLTIEGFKGFTAPKTIDVEGRHVFLLGENNNGKSSIIEAVRWGLFGSTNRRNEVVDNRDYQARCRVEIQLSRDAQKLQLRRTLLRGVTGGTDAELYDDSGTEVSIRELMPQLDSVDAGEGMHIIFASQSSPLSRQATDLKPFARTVFNHLGLSHPKALLERVGSVLYDQEIKEEDLGDRIDKIRVDINENHNRLQRQRSQIIASPPWKDDRIPTRVDTEQKVKRLLEERFGDSPNEDTFGVSLSALLDRGHNMLNSHNEKSRNEITAEIEDLDRQTQQLGERIAQRVELMAEIEECVREISDVLDGLSFDDWQGQLQDARRKLDIKTRRRKIDEIALTLAEDEHADEMHCPVCGDLRSIDKLLPSIRHRMDIPVTSEDEKTADIENRVESARELTAKKERMSREVDAITVQIQGSEDDAEYIQRCLVNPTFIDTQVSQLRTRRNDLQSQIDNMDAWRNECEAELSALEEENRFHDLQREITRSDRLHEQLELVDQRLKDFGEFGEATREIRTEIEIGLNNALRKDIPRVSDSFTRVFNALTQHPRYDRLRFNDDVLPELDLVVASSQDPTGVGHSTEVLNGQAESALLLVPYFAFSQDDETPTEAYLVLLDDPTRAFDERHIDVLVGQLAELGRHVQLFVASQETRQFKHLLPKYFQSSDYVVVEPRAWSYESGPEVLMEFPDR